LKIPYLNTLCFKLISRKLLPSQALVSPQRHTEFAKSLAVTQTKRVRSQTLRNFCVCIVKCHVNVSARRSWKSTQHTHVQDLQASHIKETCALLLMRIPVISIILSTSFPFKIFSWLWLVLDLLRNGCREENISGKKGECAVSIRARSRDGAHQSLSRTFGFFNYFLCCANTSAAELQ
jgi:hypothetical protein